MYGLLCENVKNLIISKHGEEMWHTVRELMGLKNQSFVLHDVYSDDIICRIARAYSETTNESIPNIMHHIGVNFVSFVEANGYSQLLKVLGRNMRDFLNGLDNLHEYLRFSYPKLRPPSFFVEKERADGMILHYASKRVGFLEYVVGQIKEVGKRYYDVAVDVEILDYKEDQSGCHVVLDLLFDNKDYVSLLENNYVPDENHQDSNNLFVDADMFFEIYPFYVMIDDGLIITAVGNGLSKVINKNIVGKKIDQLFQLIRPTFNLAWENLVHTNTLFEFVAKDCLKSKGERKKLHLRGNMMLLSSQKSVLFLATPVLESVEQMYDVGVYIHDLALHDLSRDLALHSLHYSDELKTALDRERHKSAMLEESVQCLEKEKRRADSLLYRMIPKQIADRLRKGESTLSMCETFENVTILFSDVVGFTNICTKLSPMEVVTMLNSMYIKFDSLSVQYGVYKVEIIGDGYMLVSGIPVPTENHADNVADMALEMHAAIKSIPNPAENDKDGYLEIRTGVHSGMVVAGVVGIKMPRYCLFGDTVNIASKMESNGSPHASHISEATKNSLTEDKYFTIFRGNFGIKGVFMRTYWLLGIKEENAVVNYADTSRYLPVENVFSKLSRDSSPVCGSASQKLISPELDDLSFSDRCGLMDSPSNFVTQTTCSEMEQYIIDNNIALFSDESNATDCLASFSGSHALSQQSSINQNFLESSNSSKHQSKSDNSLLVKSCDAAIMCSRNNTMPPCNSNDDNGSSTQIKQKKGNRIETKCTIF